MNLVEPSFTGFYLVWIEISVEFFFFPMGAKKKTKKVAPERGKRKKNQKQKRNASRSWSFFYCSFSWMAWESPSTTSTCFVLLLLLLLFFISLRFSFVLLLLLLLLLLLVYPLRRSWEGWGVTHPPNHPPTQPALGPTRRGTKEPVKYRFRCGEEIDSLDTPHEKLEPEGGPQIKNGRQLDVARPFLRSPFCFFFVFLCLPPPLPFRSSAIGCAIRFDNPTESISSTDS